MGVGLARSGSADAACEVASSKTVVLSDSNKLVRALIISFASSSLASAKENYILQDILRGLYLTPTLTAIVRIPDLSLITNRTPSNETDSFTGALGIRPLQVFIILGK